MSNKTDNIRGILDPQGINDNPLNNKPFSEKYRNLAKIWSKFPAYGNPEKIIDDISNHSVILVVSGTGSGKTVLFPKYLLHALNYDAKIAITLPKQIIAKSAAEFAADTLDVVVGEEVGYQYRNSGKNTFSRDKTKLLYCTDGTLVARLLSDPLLKDFDSVIIDEAHERKVNIDFLLFLLRNVLKERPEFKLIIMSATIDQQMFKNYFNEFPYIDIAIGTKTNYPIESIFLKENLNIDKNEYMEEGVKLIEKLLRNKEDKSGILFFVTSVSETNSVCDKLSADNVEFKDNNVCVPVYSGMNAEQQKIATDKDYYRGFIKDGRKILVATNVAESSLTIEGISHVIDSGLELRSRFDPINRVNILEKIMITHAQAKQRMGRTGRTGPGICHHLYTETMFNETMERFPSPSIKVEAISYELLRLLAIESIKTVGRLKEILNQFIEPPEKNFVKAELKYLHTLGLITDYRDDGILSDVGNIINSLQLEPQFALALLTAYRLNCFREVSAIVSMIDVSKGSIGDLFVLPTDILGDTDPLAKTNSDEGKKKRENKLKNKFDNVKKEFDNRYGDHIALLKIFSAYEKIVVNSGKDYDKLNEWTYRYFLKRDRLNSAYQSYIKIKYRVRQRVAQYTTQKYSDRLSNEILHTDIKYRILASLISGYELNILKVEDKKIEMVNGNIKNIQLDPNSFLTLEENKNGRLFYHQLFRYGNNPVKAKITSKVSKKSLDILKQVREA